MLASALQQILLGAFNKLVIGYRSIAPIALSWRHTHVSIPHCSPRDLATFCGGRKPHHHAADILTGIAPIHEREHGTEEHLPLKPVRAAKVMPAKVWFMERVVSLAATLSLILVIPRVQRLTCSCEGS